MDAVPEDELISFNQFCDAVTEFAEKTVEDNNEENSLLNLTEGKKNVILILISNMRVHFMALSLELESSLFLSNNRT